MKKRKNVTKRLLTFALSLAMVLTSVNISALTVYAEVGDESAALENEIGAVEQDESVAPEKETGAVDQDESVAPEEETGAVDQDESDVSEEDEEAEEPSASDETVDEDATVDQDESVVPEEDEETEEPSAAVVLGDDEETEKPSAAVVFGDDDGETEPPESTPGIGADYDRDKGEVTFWISTNDVHYRDVFYVYYRPYASVEEANAAYIGTEGDSEDNNKEGDWLSGAGKIPLTEDKVENKKSHTIKVDPDHVSAYLYFFPITRDGADHTDRVNHESICVINETGKVDVLVPPVPKGLDVEFWDLEKNGGHATIETDENLGKIRAGWNVDDMLKADPYIAGFMLSIDDEDEINIPYEGVGLAYFFDNNFAAGDHKITLRAYKKLDDSGDILLGGAVYVIFSLTADQAYGGEYADKEATLKKLKDDLSKLYNDENDNRYLNGTGNKTEIYAENSWDKYAAAMDSAKVIVDSIETAGEDAIKKAYNELLDAVKGLKEKTNIGKLQDAYDKYKEYKKDDYEDDGWKDFEDALKAAKDLLDDEDEYPPNSLIDEKLKNLEDAADNLKRKTDKSALEEAIDRCNTYDKNDYKQEGWNDFADALNAAIAVDKDTKADQDTIDSALDELLAAEKNLQIKPTLEALQKAYDRNIVRNETDYTAETWKPLAGALVVAAGVIAKGDDAEENEIETALNDLLAAENGLVKNDTTTNPDEELQELIDKLKDAIDESEKELEEKEDEYTKESVKNLKDELDNARDLLDKEPPATKDEINDELEALDKAKNDLKPKTPKDKLKDAIDKYEQFKKDDYEDDGWDEFEDALDEAKKVKDDDDATDDEIEDALKKLEDAANNLTKKLKLSDLIAAIEKYKKEYPDEHAGKYTENSWEEFQKALDEAQAVVDKGEDAATEGEIKDALENLVNAVKDLEKKPTKENLQDAYDKYEKEKEDKDKYTDDSWQDFEDALDKAKDVLEKDDATDDEIENALKDLEDAANNRVPKDKVGLWVQEIPSQTYTGSAIKPVIRVYEGTKLLEEKTDYTVSYKNNTNVGTASVTVKGKRDYGKTKIVTFRIKPKYISDADVTAADVFAVITNQNTVKNPKVTIKYGNKTLKENKDYILGWPKNTDEETQSIKPSDKYKIRVDGLGNYKGSKMINYTIYPTPGADAINMSKVKVVLDSKTVTYNGKDTVKPKVTVTYKDTPLTENTDYKLSWLNENKVGKATVTVSAILNLENSENAKNKYYGSKSVTYTVTGTPLNKTNLLIKDDETEIKNMSYPYTGSEIKVKKLKVYDVTKATDSNKGLLIEGKDYVIAYSKNINAGKAATITLTGKNGYTGKFVQKFTINKKKLDDKDNPVKLDRCDPATATYTKNKAVPEFTMTYNDVQLREKLDYTVKCVNNKATGAAAEITITGKGNYEGTQHFGYTVEAPSPSTLYVADIVMPNNVTTDKVKKAVKVYESSTGKALKAGTDYDKNSIGLYVKDDEGQYRDVKDSDLTLGKEIFAKITLLGNYKQADPNEVEPYPFYLCNKDATTFKIVKVATQEYTGKAVKPKLTVLAKDGTRLDEGKHYLVTYSNNIERGTGKATVTGIDPICRGVKTVTFKIGTRNLDTPGNWFKEVQAATKNLINTVSNFFNR